MSDTEVEECEGERSRLVREYRTLADNLPDPVLRVLPDLTIASVNRAVLELHEGRDAGDFVGKKIGEAGEPAELVANWRRAVSQVLKTAALVEGSFEWEHAGRIHMFASRYCPEFDGEGNVTSVLVVSMDITERRRAETEQRNADEQRRQLVSRLVTAQEEERKRIAADVHDDSIQIMTAASMRLEVLQASLEDGTARQAAERAAETVRSAISRLRHLLFSLRPPELDGDGLAAAVELYLTSLGHEPGPEYVLENRLRHEPSPETRVVLYRILQEALTNVRKHAAARHVRVTLTDRDGCITATVADDGIGLSADATAYSPGHLGLVSMHERAQVAGGGIRLLSEPGGGTTVQVWLPSDCSVADSSGVQMSG